MDAHAAARAQETQDNATAGDQVAQYPGFVSQLTDAVSKAWPKRFSTGYSAVKVLLISWENDDLDVDDEIRPLTSVLSHLYHYDVEVWKIPTTKPSIRLSTKVTSLLEGHGNEGNLVIIYYAGHARVSEQPGGSNIWAATRDDNSLTLQSSVIHSLLGEVDCDVLLLYDACHAIQAGDASKGHGVVETIAACGFESIAAEVGQHSFTHSLIDELAHATRTTEWLTVVELHRRLINRLQAWMPSVRFTSSTNSVVQVDQYTRRALFDTPRRRTPIYCRISKKPGTIMLSPLSPAQVRHVAKEPFVWLNPPAPSMTGPAIHLSCQLRDQGLEVRKWKNWILTAPQEVSTVHISTVYPGSRHGAGDYSRDPAKGKGISAMWPDAFAYDQTAVYAAEDEPHCLKLAMRYPDTSLSMVSLAERILDIFTEDVGDPSIKNIYDEIKSFCGSVDVEGMIAGRHEHAEAVALLDERSPPTNQDFDSPRIYILTPTQLLNTLSLTELSLPAVETGSNINRFVPRRRLL
ncbi:hypothetical protein QBC40DRAFT_96539 [Triangularia verruculosa]|uniref:Caspase domain-containing protein n=1 Tax=Triangularia verruculosa TaxID=2587418 RepID=A0AAN6XC44_9PEZI|nr:hypothetical protein QBC40DRAFT_96539 [Triangularia verruculosa]